MARGGARPGAGRPRKSAVTPEAQKTKKTAKGKAVPADQAALPPDITKPAAELNLTPLEYMLKVMNDTGTDAMRRDRMAMAAAPFVHMRPSEAASPGKRKLQEEAAKEANNKFKRAQPPRLVANNG